MVPFARALRAAGRDHGLAVWVLRYRFQGWNAPDLDPVRDAHWALDKIARERPGVPGVPGVLVGHGLIPCVPAIEQTVRAHTELRFSASRSFGLDYAETLRQWRETFLSRWETITELGFDDTFRRMWEFYLAYSEAGFRVGYLDVRQCAYVKA
jgi:hypothetical protein